MAGQSLSEECDRPKKFHYPSAFILGGGESAMTLNLKISVEYEING